MSGTSIGTVTYAIGALAFVLLALLLINRTRGLQGALILIAVVTTGAWTGASAAYYWTMWDWPRVIAALEIARFLAWIAFLGSLFYSGSSDRERAAQLRYLAPAVVLVVATLGAIAILPAGPILPGTLTPNSVLALALAVVGMFLTEILFRNTPPDERWQIKFLCLATGTIFTYDLFLYADATLFGRVDPVLLEARGAVQALAAPLLAVAAARKEIWQTNISISRQVVLGSSTLIASGLYLSLAAAVGFVLREIDEAGGPVVQVIFFVGALAVLAIVLSSGAYWAHAKNFVNKHFYKQKYDWREEWLRFMHTISAGQSAAPLEERCVKAIADIVESPGGVMWLVNDDRCEHACSWNFTVPDLSEQSAHAFARSLGPDQSVIDLEHAIAGTGLHGTVAIPDALRSAKRAWLIVPLWHRSLVGLVVLARPRAPRTLEWEDYDLLDVVGRQTASYLAEQKAVEALEQAREFEIFNRRFAFVIHDVKNLVSQLSVLGLNFEKHGHRKAFRDDVVATINDAAKKMKQLMERIHALEPNQPAKEAQLLEPLIRRVITAQKGSQARVVLDGEGCDLAVLGDRDRLEAVIGHLLRNAIEAVDGTGTVRIGLRRNGRFAVVDVADEGPGMDRDFIRRELFKPFQSTKKEGMGIGAYQCREYARELGGNLEAISAPGEGTIMRITLPIAKTA
ncbi:MAG: XrtA/PEP-CTERM system histidine kinase PrsK [Kiloniellaceae bacterium]